MVSVKHSPSSRESQQASLLFIFDIIKCPFANLIIVNYLSLTLKGGEDIMKRSIAIALTAASLLATSAGIAFAAGNPSGTGQPSVECDEEGATMIPHGFETSGFEIAEAMYAGSEDTNSLHSDNSHAVSQYDVACYQITQHHESD